jgi:recombinational DNA repair ATPase RecF
METPGEMDQLNSQVETLESEVKAFAESLPYWAKYLSEKLLAGRTPTEEEITIAYSFLLEDTGLAVKTNRPEIAIIYSGGGPGGYKTDLTFAKLRNIEGVNALAGNQIIEFSPFVTIIYGINGSGKTGYIRLLKKAFYSKAEEKIIQNIHSKADHKPLQAEFVFSSSGAEYSVHFPAEAVRPEFSQYAVFDGKSVLTHLDARNEFEFRPAGLSFFGELTTVFKQVEQKIQTDITTKSTEKDYGALFDGDSPVKTLLANISAKSKIEDLKKHLPFTEPDMASHKLFEEQKAQLLTLKKDKEIASLDEVKRLIGILKQGIEVNNKHFSAVNILKIHTAIADCNTKEASAKREGIESFKSELLKGIGSSEWKDFIEAAGKFAELQESEQYPQKQENCLFCQQPMSEQAQRLVLNYWKFLKSQAEKDAKDAQLSLTQSKALLGKLKFDLLPIDSILKQWLISNYSKELKPLTDGLIGHKTLSENLISDIVEKRVIKREQEQIGTVVIDTIVKKIEEQIKELKEKEPVAELERLNLKIITLAHRQKLGQHIDAIEIYINNLKWATTAGTAKRQTATKKITEKEKELSGKYFNEAYAVTFNSECETLNGNFGIALNHSGTMGTSYRQLKYKDYYPSEILSEGEQKVISLADFLSEIQHSGVNKGIIFDDPVNSLDEERKASIGERLVREAKVRQVIIFTHDLVFISSILSACEGMKVGVDCHWVDKSSGKPGTVFLKNAPSYEKMYKKSGKAQQYYEEAKKCGPEESEDKLKSGFGALRTSYESMVIFDLFNGVVQRFNERISVDSLSNVYFDTAIRDELIDSFSQCCRYMEGHSHSDKYAYKKPTAENLNEEIIRFNAVKNKIAALKLNALKN